MNAPELKPDVAGTILTGAVAESVRSILGRMSPGAILLMRGLDRHVTAAAQAALLGYVLELTDHNQSKTARILGVNRTTLRSWMKANGHLAGDGGPS